MFYEVFASFKVKAESKEDAEKQIQRWLDEALDNLALPDKADVYIPSEMTEKCGWLG